MSVILITGASSGIGKAAAREFAHRGHTVYAAARRVEQMKDLQGIGVHAVYLDVTDDESCRQCVSGILAQQGRLDVLVNNAGYGEYGPIECVPVERAKAQLDVNLLGAVRMIRLTAPHMRARGGGRIINISSAGGRTVTYLGGWYHAAKYALEAVSDSLRMELREYGVDVVLIEPGGVASAWGGITAERLSTAGKGTVYEQACDEVAGVYRQVYAPDSRILTSPDRVARMICRAAAARRPHTRYLFGFGARSLVVMHALLPTRAYDRLMTGMYRSKAAQRILTKNK